LEISQKVNKGNPVFTFKKSFILIGSVQEGSVCGLRRRIGVFGFVAVIPKKPQHPLDVGPGLPPSGSVGHIFQGRRKPGKTATPPLKDKIIFAVGHIGYVKHSFSIYILIDFSPRKGK
jgi:hypothetical protein